MFKIIFCCAVFVQFVHSFNNAYADNFDQGPIFFGDRSSDATGQRYNDQNHFKSTFNYKTPYFTNFDPSFEEEFVPEYFKNFEQLLQHWYDAVNNNLALDIDNLYSFLSSQDSFLAQQPILQLQPDFLPLHSQRSHAGFPPFPPLKPLPPLKSLPPLQPLSDFQLFPRQQSLLRMQTQPYSQQFPPQQPQSGFQPLNVQNPFQVSQDYLPQKRILSQSEFLPLQPFFGSNSGLGETSKISDFRTFGSNNEIQKLALNAAKQAFDVTSNQVSFNPNFAFRFPEMPRFPFPAAPKPWYQNFGNGANNLDANSAYAYGAIGPDFQHQIAAVNPQNPAMPNIDIMNRFGPTDSKPGYKSVSSFSSSVSSNINGKPTNSRISETVINKDGKITKYRVQS